jgi:transcriptional regulator with XRE-family HTH domain
MGYRGKTAERWAARDLRKQSWTLQEIADHLGVAKSSVSLWVRDVEFEPKPRNNGRKSRMQRPGTLQLRKWAEIAEMREEGLDRIGRLTEKEFLVAGVALYAGEGAKTDGAVKFANSDPRMILFFCTWLRRFFEIDESRLRVRQYLHQGLDLEAADAFWSELTGIPLAQFLEPYRAVPDPSIRKAKHIYGCPAVGISSSRVHRAVMDMVDALLSCQSAIPG